MRVELLSVTPDGEALIAHAARVSHRSEARASPEADHKLIRRLIELGHESVLEFAHATFLIDGISRACANQLVRHRLASYVQESQRYVDVGERSVVCPPRIEEHSACAGVFRDAVGKAREAYAKLLSLGVPKEDARYVLPLGTGTALVMSANFREWRHILKLRMSREAQWEIRDLAQRILGILREHAPNVFGDQG